MKPLRKFTTIKLFCLVAVMLPTTFGAAFSQRSAERTPLEWARILVREIQPENTSYQHKQGFVHWKGDTGVDESESRTDCSGLLNALLERSYSLAPQDFETWVGKRRPLAVDYFEAITHQEKARRITNVGDVRPGDVIAIRYPPGTNENTGHIMLVAGEPQPRKSSKPEIDNTAQWELNVIDSSESGHGKTDTRHRPDGTFGSGVGQGILRIYSDPTGQIVGYTWSTFANSDYYDQQTRQLVIGRLRLQHRTS